MKKTIIILSMLFVAVVAVGVFFTAPQPVLACSTCTYGSDTYYFDDYYPTYSSPSYDDYYYYSSPSYDYGYYYFTPTVYQPPVYYPPVYTPPTYTPPTYTPPTPPTCSLSSTQTNVNAGTPVTISWTASNATNGFISNGVGTVSPSYGTYTVSPTVTTTYVGTFSGSGGATTCQTTVVVQQQQPPTCSLTVSNYSGNNSAIATLTWTTNNATSAYIDQNIGTVNTGSGSRTVNPSNNGTTVYTMNVSGQGGTATCQATVNYNQGYQPWCTLSVSSNSIGSGQASVIQWNTSGNATSFYVTPNVGNVNTGSGSRTVYPNTTTTYTGTVYSTNGQSATCQTTVGVYAASNVSLYQQPGNQPLASVSLTQIPYTGFAAGPLVTFVFWLVVALWSFGLAYIFMGKRGLQLIAKRAFGYEPAIIEYAHTPVAMSATPQKHATREDEYVNGFNVQETQPSLSVTTPVAQTAAVAPTVVSLGEEDLQSTIESRAHKAGVLLSPEATSAALELSSDPKELLTIFNDIVSEAIRTLPREDGWVLLSSDRFDDLAAKYTGAPEISPEDLSV